MTVATPSLALVAGGGSGGHVFPGLAVAEVLAERGWSVAWIGSDRGMERELVARAGLDFHAAPARPFLGRGLFDRLGALLRLLRSAVGLRGLIRELGARVLLGTGGYISAPAVVAARWARRPVVLFEPNAEAGLANRMLSRLASEAAVAHRETAGGLRCPVELTGIPVRGAFFDAAGALETKPPHRILVVGGSQGARQLNRALPVAAGRVARERPLRITHQAGPADVETVEAAYRDAGVDADVLAFVDDMPAAMGSHQLLVSRAGAITLAEICAAGRPSILVPLAAAEGHQVGNARALVDAGAARMLASDRFDADSLAELLDALLADAELRRRMGAAARRLAHRNAAAAIADRLVARAEGAR